MKLRDKKILKHFKDTLKTYLFTTRFTNETHREFVDYLNTKNKQCIYNVPTQVTHVPLEKILFVLEMNNDKNEIMGIGMVRNHPYLRRYNIYKNENYNRYNYVGNCRIDRLQMDDEEIRLMKALEYLCFKSPNHLKRQHGLTMFPIIYLFRTMKILNIMEFLSNMFKKRLN